MKTKRMMCMDCGKVFEMSKKEIEWYRKKGFHSPGRCGSCRALRRQDRRRWMRRVERYAV